MDTKQLAEERLLQAFLEMSAFIRGNRFLTHFSFNEIMICNLLYRRQQTVGTPPTATEICSWTKLLKSQVNHILTSMEDRGLICRQRSVEDKRVIYVTLREEALPLYLEEHKKILQIMDHIYETMGVAQVEKLTQLVSQATTIVDESQRS